MKKQFRWDIVWAWVAIGLIIIIAGWGIGLAINNIDLTPSQVYTFDGVLWECSFSALGEMEGCHQVNDPDVGFGKANP